MSSVRLFLAYFILAAITGCSADFLTHRVDNIHRDEVATRGATITWAGVTTFLIDDGRSQVLFDGFFSRPNHLSVGIAPDLERVQNSLVQLGVRSSGCEQSVQNCTTEDQTGLELIIPFHGHFDHAMDSPLVSSITGATLISDESVEPINNATQRFFGVGIGNTDVLLIDDVPQILRREGLDVGGMSIRLFETPHIHSIASYFAEGVTDQELTFPASVTALKEGRSFSALVTHKDANILIVPSAGDIKNEFVGEGVAASTVILGIGLAGWKSEDELEQLWTNAVKRVGACRVALVHWDDASGAVSIEGQSLQPLWFFQLDRTLSIFSRLALRDKVEIVHLPVAQQVSLTSLGAGTC